MNQKKGAIWVVIVSCGICFFACELIFHKKAFANNEQVRVTLDDKKATLLYSNLVNVKGTYDEVVFDFAFIKYNGDQDYTHPTSNLQVVMNYFTAKRMWSALQFTVARHESNFGICDVQLLPQPDPNNPAAEIIVPQKIEIPDIPIDNLSVTPTYSNFSRITGTPEEVFIDFAINPNPFGSEDQILPVNNRVILNLRNAKHTLQKLEKVIHNYEITYGKIELDVRRRLKTAQ